MNYHTEHTPHTQTIYHSPNTVFPRLREVEAGAWIEYHRGLLSADICASEGECRADMCLLRQKLWEMYLDGKIFLAQRRIAPLLFSYLAIPTKEPPLWRAKNRGERYTPQTPAGRTRLRAETDVNANLKTARAEQAAGLNAALAEA